VFEKKKKKKEKNIHTLVTSLKTTLIPLRIMIPTKIIINCRDNLDAKSSKSYSDLNLNLDSASGSAFTSIAVGDEDIFLIWSERR
jgi:hypothetical protein